MRRVLSLALVLLVAATILLWRFSMPLTLTVGSARVALVQSGAVLESQFVNVAPQLAAPSTPGTLLVVMAANGSLGIGSYGAAFPTGWSRVAWAQETTNADFEIWIYPNNPGGIQSVTFTPINGGPGGADWWAQMSEWSGVGFVNPVLSSATATGTSGTTLVPAMTSAVVASGSVALAGWLQRTAGAGAVTFTSPAGWTRLADDSATVTTKHLDLEYMLSVPPGPPLSPTLTSSGTTSTAAGAAILLTAATPASDMTAYLAHPD